jgi:hypothetical protein
MKLISKVVNWLKHAFAVEVPGAAEPSEAQRAIIEKLCREVVRRRMTTPALLMLETGRPLNYVSAQLLHFFQPMLSFLANAAEYQAFTEFLEQRGSIDYIVARLETLNEEASTTSHDTN